MTDQIVAGTPEPEPSSAPHPNIPSKPQEGRVSIYCNGSADLDFEKGIISSGYTMLYVNGEAYDWSRYAKQKSMEKAFPKAFQDYLSPTSDNSIMFRHVPQNDHGFLSALSSAITDSFFDGQKLDTFESEATVFHFSTVMTLGASLMDTIPTASDKCHGLRAFWFSRPVRVIISQYGETIDEYYRKLERYCEQISEGPTGYRYFTNYHWSRSAARTLTVEVKPNYVLLLPAPAILRPIVEHLNVYMGSFFVYADKFAPDGHGLRLVYPPNVFVDSTGPTKSLKAPDSDLLIRNIEEGFAQLPNSFRNWIDYGLPDYPKEDSLFPIYEDENVIEAENVCRFGSRFLPVADSESSKSSDVRSVANEAETPIRSESDNGSSDNDRERRSSDVRSDRSMDSVDTNKGAGRSKGQKKTRSIISDRNQQGEENEESDVGITKRKANHSDDDDDIDEESEVQLPILHKSDESEEVESAHDDDDDFELPTPPKKGKRIRAKGSRIRCKAKRLKTA